MSLPAVQPVPEADRPLETQSFPQTLNGVPKLTPTQERLTRLVAVVAWAYGLYWLLWRWTETFNWSSPVFSFALLAAETYGLINFGLFIFTVWKIERREPPKAPDGLSVDVFITCYDEPLQVIRRTAIGARAIRYPHKTYILDDGKRDEVRAMARSLGIGYIRRKGNEHAKAGNLNHAIKHTRGEFILQLDADHVPLPQILDRMLGYFTDPKVAFIQSPQDYYNTTDSFTHVVNDEGRRLWEENRIFFSLVQVGRDAWNASFFCGSCGMLRRQAMMEIGGFSTLSVTEDLETSIVLHSRGWKSVYHGETLAFGLAPASAGQYHVQRLRWGQGAMQIARKMNPLFIKGLTLPQRILYFSSSFTYLDGLQRMVFYLAPLVFLYTGAFPLRASEGQLLIRLVPYLVLTITAFEMMSRGTGWILISERYSMTRFFTHVLAVSGYFTKKPIKFNVTPKGEGSVPWRTYAPQLVLAALCVLSLPFMAVAQHFGLINYHVGGLGSSAMLLNAVWVCWNLYFAVFVVRHSILSRQRRQDYRFLDATPAMVRVLGSDLEPHMAMTNELNAKGLSFRSSIPLPVNAKVEIPLSLSSGEVHTTGTIARVIEQSTRFGTVYTHGVRFDELPIATRDAIEVHCTHHAVPFWRSRYRQSIHLLHHVAERLSDLRISRRRPVSLPALVHALSADVDGGTDAAPSHTDIALLEETSGSGARLVMSEPVTPGSRVAYEVPGTSLKGQGVVVFSQAFESTGHVRFAVGICSDLCERRWWQRAMSKRSALPFRSRKPPAVEPITTVEAPVQASEQLA